MMDITRIKRAEIALHRRNNIIKKINLELQKELAKRENQGKQLKHEATHDYLTGLPTRALLFDRLEQALAYDGRHNNHLLALMVLDVDDFKAINDTFGHAGGDIILKEVAARLHQCMRQ
jgi:GGDEF domain-containing protein